MPARAACNPAGCAPSSIQTVSGPCHASSPRSALSTQFPKYGDVFCGRWLGELGRAVLGKGEVMPRNSPFFIKLTRGERAELIRRAGQYRSAYRDVIRARIVLLVSEGLANDVIGTRLDTPRQIVSKWRQPFLRRFPVRAGRHLQRNS